MDGDSLVRDVRTTLDWLPDWLIGVIFLALAGTIALLLHGAIFRLVRRLIGADHLFFQTLLARAKGITRFALVVFALGAILPSLPFTAATTTTIGQILLIAFVCLLGWACIVAVNLAADLYLRRFRVDVEDNLLARKHVTQVRILRRTAVILIGVLTAAIALMTLETVRNYGISLFASAGAAGLVVGLAARPVLANIIAGIQIAMTQPIRIDDAVVVEGEWGWIEEITSSYVVIRLWDWRRLIVPLAHFIEKPFQNWTRHSASIIGTVFLFADYRVPVARLREKLTEIAKASPRWDGQVVNLQVTDATDRTVQIRALVSARNSPEAWDLRCEVREKLLAFLQQEHPEALPRQRIEWPERQPDAVEERGDASQRDLPPLRQTAGTPSTPERAHLSPG